MSKEYIEIEVYDFDDIISDRIVRMGDLDGDYYITDCGFKFYDTDIQQIKIECIVDDEKEINYVSVDREELHHQGFDLHKIIRLRTADLGDKVSGHKILDIESKRK
jgi:hypothetical protein